MSADRFSHTYTQLLVACVLSYQMKDGPWWHFFVAIVVCAALSLIVVLIGEALKGE